MKSKIYIPLIIAVLILNACQKLDRMVITGLTEDVANTNYGYTMGRAAALYLDLPAGFLSVDGAMMASATDEAEHTLETSGIQKFNVGSWDSYNNPDDAWSKYYAAIRKVNLFLENSNNVNLDANRLNPAKQSVYLVQLAEVKRWKYEARFLGAFYYFELVKHYGGVPLLKRPMLISDDYKNITRNTLADCIKYITDECDSAATILPVTYTSTDLGRATKGAALALKSKVLLYAASELFNNTTWASGYAHPELISLTGDRTARWQAAADAAKAVMDLTGTGYTLSANYSSLFSISNFSNSEIILARRNGASNSFEIASYPVGYDLGKSGTTPSQNLIDTYEMTNGKPITDQASGYDPLNPYSGRDPRLSLTVLTNNTTFKGRPVESWVGGRDGYGIELATKTGYYLKKYVDGNLDLLLGRTSVHSWVLIRLPEIWLNYAEALNECSAGHPDIKTYVDLVRQRTGVAMPVLPAGLSQAEMRDRIRNERRVEFAFEDHRFWDVRRWMLGTVYFKAPLKGMRITKNPDNTFTYQVIDVENRVFEPKMYLYPIPVSETLLATGLVQNPLW